MAGIAERWSTMRIATNPIGRRNFEEISVAEWLRERLLASAGLGPFSTPMAGLGNRVLVLRSHVTRPASSNWIDN
jgi:hypothetical protein